MPEPIVNLDERRTERTVTWEGKTIMSPLKELGDKRGAVHVQKLCWYNKILNPKGRTTVFCRHTLIEPMINHIED
jgi:hypothetical protein